MDAVDKLESLKNDLKEDTLSSLYVWYGEESYLKATWLRRILDKVLKPEDRMMNYDELSSPDSDEPVIRSAETLPFMAEHRLVVVRESGFFAGDGGDHGGLIHLFQHMPDSVILIFIESRLDKRSRLLKAADQYGETIEFTTPDDQTLIRWMAVEGRRRKLKIDRGAAAALLNQCGQDMHALETAMQKVFAYKEGSGVVLEEDVWQVMTPNPETNVFRMMDAIGNHQAQKAFEIYQNLRQQGENEYYIFSLLRRQIDILYKTGIYLYDHVGENRIAQEMKLRPFAVRRNIAQARQFSLDALRQAMRDTLAYEVEIKKGRIHPQEAIEILIARYGSRPSRA